MRALIGLFFGILAIATGVALGLLIAGNEQMASFGFFGATARAPLAMLVGIAGALGFVLSLVLLLPGRIAGARRVGEWARYADSLEDQFAALRREHVRLQAAQQRLLAERQGPSAKPSAAAPAPAASAPMASPTRAAVPAAAALGVAPLVGVSAPPHPPRRTADLFPASRHNPSLASPWERLRARLRAIRSGGPRRGLRVLPGGARADDAGRGSGGPAAPAA